MRAMRVRSSLKRKITKGVGGVIINEDGCVLVIKENSSNPGYGKQKGMLSIPFGRVGNRGQEEERRAIVREVREETGCETEVRINLGTILIPGATVTVFLLKMKKERLDLGSLNPRWMPVCEILNLPQVRPPTKAAIQIALCWETRKMKGRP